MTGRETPTANDSTERRGKADTPDGKPRIERRALLRAAVASAAASGLAGCSGDGDSAGTPTPTTGPTPTPGPATPDCGTYESLEQSDLDGGATIEAGCYRIDDKYTVDTGTLTLEAGVLIQFGEHAGIEMAQGGSLRSNGTPQRPVFLQGATAARGHWRGIAFTGDGTNGNVLEHTVLEHAGSELWTGDQATNAAMFITKAAVDLQSCTLRHNAGKALLARNMAADLSIAETLFDSNEVPIRINGDHVGSFAPNNVVENNDDDRVTVAGNNSLDDIVTDQAWEDPGVPFHVVQDLRLTATLTIREGATFDFGDQQGLDVDGGQLVVAGTASDPVRMRGDTSERGFWRGVRFRNTTAENAFEHVVLKDAGGELWHGADFSKAGLFVQGDAVSLRLGNSTFANNDVCGVTATGTGYDLTVERCAFTGNVEPLRVSADLVKGVAATNSYSGNDGSYVRVGIRGARTNVLRQATWPARDVPYRLDRDLSVRADLEVAPGATIEAETKEESDNVTIDVPGDYDGSLAADASDSDEETIVFTASTKEPGNWGGIHFSTGNQRNALRNVVVEYAGGELNNGDLDSKACVVAWESGTTPSVSLEQVTLRGSAKHGIYKECAAGLSCGELTFENIAGANFWDAGEDGPVTGCAPTC